MGAGALLDLDGLTKHFPGVLANDAVSFSIAPGEIHALLGENGAGKSTLVKMIYGVMHPDEGAMRFGGEPYAPTRPFDARAAGIGMVFQHFSLFAALTVAENIALGVSPQMGRDNLKARIVEVSTAYGLRLDPDRQVGTLSVGERQRIEIVRCLLQNPKLLIMDEPTSVLTPGEVETLFKTLRRLAAEGCSILYISHKLEEIRQLCDTATVLRGGKVVAECTPADETAKSLAEMMIGTTLTVASRGATATGEVRLSVLGLSVQSDVAFGTDLADISFDVAAGEIFGIAGVAGNGQTELMEVLVGELMADTAGAITIDGKPVGKSGPLARRRLGLCSVPEERLGHAAVPDMTLWENAVLSAQTGQGLIERGFIRVDRAIAFATRVVKDFGVQTAGVEHAARSLSGGNLQKFTVGREILQSPKVLVANQPTWGVDANAAAAIHQVLLDLARDGAAIVIISQDLDELMAISTRIAVIAEGHLSPADPVSQVTVEKLGVRMGGHAGGPAPAQTEGAHA
ncbi:ABC transporter ATP-binding protein [hydrothermal vent metagenome]|uniref:ABC transporter ATP-binding protein n=1 Tax=hydrothermal vent metagenome TaxID=652676 RepID=A0A3B0TEF7_9ZZZZ